MTFLPLTFLLLPGFLLCQVSQEVQRGLGLGRGDRSTSCVAAWTASSTAPSVSLRLGSSLVRVLLRARLSFHQGQFVTVVQDVLQNLAEKGDG